MKISKIKSLLLLVILFIIPSISYGIYTPQLHFSDINSGPQTGNTDGFNGLTDQQHGAIVTIWGNGLGEEQGESILYMKDSQGIKHEIENIYYWKNADGQLPGGPSDLYSKQKMQEIAFSIPSDIEDGTSKIFISKNGLNSSELDFLVRPGNIYFIDNNGENNADGSFNNPWKELNYVATPSNNKLVAGDIIYLLDYIQNTMVQIGTKEPNNYVGTIDNPYSVITYPGQYDNYLSNVDSPSDQNRNINYHSTISNHWGKNTFWNFSKLRIETNNNGINGFYKMRFIGNEITGPYAEGFGGAVTGGGELGSGIKVYGNYIHDFGNTNTSNFHHIFYVSNRSYATVEAYELSWNHLKDNGAPHALHIFDQNGQGGDCGGGGENGDGSWSGKFQLKNNVIHNQVGCGFNYAGGCGYKGDFSADVDLSNNIFINDPDSPLTGTPICLETPWLDGTVQVNNNIVYGYGSNTKTGSLALSISYYFSGISNIYNNIFVDRSGNKEYANYIMPTNYANNVFFSTVDPEKSLPGWGDSNFNIDPLFTSPETYDFDLKSNSPLIDNGYNIGEKDAFGNIRPSGIGYDIGAYEYIDQKDSVGTGTYVHEKENLTKIHSFDFVDNDVTKGYDDWSYSDIGSNECSAYNGSNYANFCSPDNKKFYPYYNGYNESHHGYYRYGFMDSEDRLSVSGNALEIHYTGGAYHNENGELSWDGLPVHGKSEYEEHIANGNNPYSTRPLPGNLQMYIKNSSSTKKFDKLQGKNRFSMRVLLPEEKYNLDKQSFSSSYKRPSHTFSWFPFIDDSRGGHYYHHAQNIGLGGWTHILFDAHPSHHNAGTHNFREGGTDAPGNGEDYFNRIVAYSFSTDAGKGMPSPIKYYYDEVEAYKQKYENEETITSLGVGYSFDKQLFDISLEDKYRCLSCQAKYEIKYSFEPIDNANYDNAYIPKEVINFDRSKNNSLGEIYKANPGYNQLWSAIDIQDQHKSLLVDNKKIYFAVKDLTNRENEYDIESVFVPGLGNIPKNELIKTIDYKLIPVIREIEIKNNQLTNATKNLSYNEVIKITGGVKPLNIDIAGLPEGITLDEENNLIGSTEIVGDYNIIINISDNSPITNDYQKEFILKVTPQELCYDGIDNNLDGKIDCNDSFCYGECGKLIIDFGSNHDDNIIGDFGWDNVIKDVYTGNFLYGSTTLIGTSAGYNYQGLTGSGKLFQQGDRIVTTWYNNTDKNILFTPRISFTDSGRLAGGEYSFMQSLSLDSGKFGNSEYVIDQNNSGIKEIININSNKEGNRQLILDKILYIKNNAVVDDPVVDDPVVDDPVVDDPVVDDPVVDDPVVDDPVVIRSSGGRSSKRKRNIKKYEKIINENKEQKNVYEKLEIKNNNTVEKEKLLEYISKNTKKIKKGNKYYYEINNKQKQTIINNIREKLTKNNFDSQYQSVLHDSLNEITIHLSILQADNINKETKKKVKSNIKDNINKIKQQYRTSYKQYKESNKNNIIKKEKKDKEYYIRKKQLIINKYKNLKK